MKNPVHAPNMAWQTIDGELVLLNIDGRELLGVNEVGARIWELADGQHDLAAIAAVISGEFEVTAEEAASEVERFVAELERAGALVTDAK
jgi:hypothetical protein